MKLQNGQWIHTSEDVVEMDHRIGSRETPFATVHYTVEHPPPKTAGEKALNWGNWYGIGWGGNFAFSLWFADKLDHGAWQPYRNMAGEWASKKRLFANTANPLKNARSIMSLAALCSGGFAVMAPIKIIENNEVPLSKLLDKVVGPSNPSEAEQTLIDARYKYLEEYAPQQSWGSVLSGRFASLIPIFAFHFSLDEPTKYGVKAINSLSGKNWKGLNQTSTDIGKWTQNLLHHVAPTKTPQWEKALSHTPIKLDKTLKGFEAIGKPVGETRFHNILTLGATDSIYDLVAAMGTEAWSKAFAGNWNKRFESNNNGHTAYQPTYQQQVNYPRQSGGFVPAYANRPQQRFASPSHPSMQIKQAALEDNSRLAPPPNQQHIN